MLTPAQQTALAADIQANTNTTLYDGVATQIKNVPHNSDGADAVQVWYNQQAAGPFYAYYTGVPIHAVQGAIRWKRLTPSDAISVSNFQQQALACQGIQFNIQLLIGTQTSLDATQQPVVQGFSDALSAVPSAANGVAQDAGWTTAVGTGLTLPQVLSRTTTNIEKLLANTTAWGQGGSGASQTPGATGPATLVFQGNIQDSDISSLPLWST